MNLRIISILNNELISRSGLVSTGSFINIINMTFQSLFKMYIKYKIVENITSILFIASEIGILIYYFQLKKILLVL